MSSQAYDWGYTAGCKNAVYATSNRDIALAFSLGAIPDKNGNCGRLIDKKYDNGSKMIFYKGHPNFGGKGYLYKLSSQGFTYTGGTQWINLEPLIPIEISEINVDDYLYLFRYATEKELQQITDEMKKANHG